MYEVVMKNKDNEIVINSVSVDLFSPKLLNGNIKKGINSIDSFTFDILPNNPGYNLIEEFKSKIDVVNINSGKIEFKGRVLISKEKMSEDGKVIKTIICESELGYLLDSIQDYGEYHNIKVRDFLKLIIDRHNKQVEEDKKLILGNITVEDNNDSLYRFINYGKTLEVIKDKLINRLGGELKIRYENEVRYLDYLSSIGRNTNLEIRLSKNLKTLEEEKDPTGIISRLTPLGAKIDDSEKRLTIESVNGGIKYIDDIEAINKFGIIEGYIKWDDVTIDSNLLKKGKKYLLEKNRVKKKYNISALDLSIIGLEIEEFEVGNIYRIINPIMNIDEDLRIIEKNINFNKPQESSLIFGEKFEDIKTYQLKNLNTIKEVDNVKTTLKTSIKTMNSISDELVNTIKVLDNTNGNVKAINEAVAINIATTKELVENINTLNNNIQSVNLIVEENSNSILNINEKLNKINNKLNKINIRLMTGDY